LGTNRELEYHVQGSPEWATRETKGKDLVYSPERSTTKEEEKLKTNRIAIEGEG